MLIAVDGPLEMRFQRLVERNRASDPKDWNGFLEMDKRDRISGTENGQQVDACIGCANVKIFNDSSLEDLKENIERILQEKIIEI